MSVPPQAAKRPADELAGEDAKRAKPSEPPSRAGSRPLVGKTKHTQIVTYKEGEALQLAKFMPRRDEPGELFIVRINTENLSGNNPQVKARQLWGCDEYTEDSDLVAVLMHMGFYNYSNAPPPPTVEEVLAHVRPLPPRNAYPCVVRNHLRSRAWSCGDAAPEMRPVAYTVERCELMVRGGKVVELKPNKESRDSQLGALPTVVPATADRAVGTRAMTAAMERKQRIVQEVSIQYSLCNEPWFKYSVPALADRGLNPSLWTSARLRDEVLYLETATERFELARGGEDAEGEHTYRLSRCRRALPLAGMKRAGVPLPAALVEGVEQGLLWEELTWAPLELVVRGGRRVPVVRFQFLPKTAGTAKA